MFNLIGLLHRTGGKHYKFHPMILTSARCDGLRSVNPDFRDRPMIPEREI